MQVISIACCVFYSHCGNIAIVREKYLDRKSSSWFSLPYWKKQDTNSWISKFIRMNEFKDQICSSWFAPVGTASDYPLFSKWVIYGEVIYFIHIILIFDFFYFRFFLVVKILRSLYSASMQWIMSWPFR